MKSTQNMVRNLPNHNTENAKVKINVYKSIVIQNYLSPLSTFVLSSKRSLSLLSPQAQGRHADLHEECFWQDVRLPRKHEGINDWEDE